jgi:3',5'-cyclic AMP phosphodiesterase CpdA/phosphotransferase system HPr-like phosphotransfer protein
MDGRQITVFTWLHVSDIHAGHGSRSDRWDQGMVLQALLRDAERARRRDVPAPDAIFVTGDIAYSGGALTSPGSDGEYDIARRWLLELATAVGVTQERIFLVPGNHDVTRATPGKDREQFRLIERLRSGAESLDEALAYPSDRCLLETRLHGYRKLASAFAEGCDQLYWARRFKTVTGKSIRVIGFDTALLANDHRDHGQLRLGKEQLACALTPGRIEPDEIVIALAHHPFSWLADHREVISWVRAHVHLVLCGHVHQAESMQLRLGGGSDFVQIVAGASHTEADDPAGHGYNFASIAVGPAGGLSVRVWPRAWSEPNQDFRLDIANVADGTSSAEHTLRLRLAASPRAGLAVRLAEAELAAASTPGMLDDLVTLLTAQGITFELVERTDAHLDLIVVDPSSLMPRALYVSVIAGAVTVDKLDDVVVRARAKRSHGHTLVLHDSSSALPANAEVELMRVAEFRDRLLHVPTAGRFVIGTLAAEALARSYHIDEVFIPPDAVPTRPDDEMEDRFWETRVPALELVDTFLADPARRVLFVLGGYGSGKSALMAHLVRRDATDDGARVAYIPLRLVATSGITTLASAAARQLRVLARDPTHRIVVLLDGLDELPNAMDPRAKRANMLEILQAARHADKLIVTARTSYFRGLADFWNLFERDGDAGLWSRLARHIPEGGGRPGVSAIILREFCSAQVEEYVLRVVLARGLDSASAKRFIAAMDAADSFGAYREMARNPLYLFLLVNTQPWEVSDVGCFADVLALFVRYWLQRDIEKGPSRWLLSMSDREELIAEVAWEMFRTRQQSMTFDTLDHLVTRYFEADAGKFANASELDAIKLDLQTTGVFTSIGGLLIFSVPAYLDYFVARRCLEGRWGRPPQLPSIAQARLWLGLVETGHAQTIPPMRERCEWDVMVEAAKTDGSAVDLSQPITLPPHGVLCGEALRAATRRTTALMWPVVNSGDPLMRAVIQLALYPRRRQHHPDERRAYLLIANALGLHARAATTLVQRVTKWLATFPPDQPPGLIIYKDDRPATPTALLSVMMLMAPRGSVIDLVYWDCSVARFEELMHSLDAVRQPETAGDARWFTDFGEGRPPRPQA